jgi:hypothetical protein
MGGSRPRRRSAAPAGVSEDRLDLRVVAGHVIEKRIEKLIDEMLALPSPIRRSTSTSASSRGSCRASSSSAI